MVNYAHGRQYQRLLVRIISWRSGNYFPPPGHIELTPDLIVDTDGQPVMSVYFEPTRNEAGNITNGGVMFCGLEDGRVRV